MNLTANKKTALIIKSAKLTRATVSLQHHVRDEQPCSSILQHGTIGIFAKLVQPSVPQMSRPMFPEQLGREGQLMEATPSHLRAWWAATSSATCTKGCFMTTGFVFGERERTASNRISALLTRFHCYKTRRMKILKPLTSQMAFNAVSVPRVKSVPGTLLLMVAGIIVIGMQNSGCLSRASAIIRILWKACTSNDSTCDNSSHTAG